MTGERSFPISRWYLLGTVEWLARMLAPTAVRPAHVTAAGVGCAAAAVAIVATAPQSSAVAAVCLACAWCCDRLDGALARRQGTASRLGAWLDANVDELVDVAMHLAIAYAAAGATGSALPWILVALFLGGKHLLLYGMAQERELDTARRESTGSEREAPTTGLLRWVYHAGGNADVRLHIVLVALVTGWFTAELIYVAAYYNLRWAVRYLLVGRRLGGEVA